MERVDIADVTAERLFDEHVSKRKPLVIRGVPTDPSFQAFKKWRSIPYLHRTAGSAPVKVEPMHASKKRYGTDVERINTTFGAFLTTLSDPTRSTYDYLTTQYSDDVSEEAFPEPVRSLLGDVPLTPAMMGNLKLQQMNLWVGRSGEGASSGLHHDFHDNLYILLKGRKRFVLFPPEAVEWFRPFGVLEKVCENGLIVYKDPSRLVVDGEEEEEEHMNQGKGDEIRGDGLSERDAAGLRVQAIEKKIADLQGVEGMEDELEGLEEILDEAVENMMDFMMEEAKDADEEDGEDDFDEDEQEEGDEELDGVMEKIGAHLEATAAAFPSGSGSGASKKRKAEDDLNGHDSKAAKSDDEEPSDYEHDDDEEEDEENSLAGFPSGLDSDDEDSDEEEAALKAALRDAQSSSTPKITPPEPSEPLSFSQIPTDELHHHLGLKQPKKTSAALSKAPEPLIVELKAGDMLYLPTSWWHEVTSFSEDMNDAGGREESEKNEEREAEGESIHMALNYWFHPPDRLDSFESPYQDELVWEYLSGKVRETYEGLVKAS